MPNGVYDMYARSSRSHATQQSFAFAILSLLHGSAGEILYKLPVNNALRKHAALHGHAPLLFNYCCVHKISQVGPYVHSVLVYTSVERIWCVFVAFAEQ